MLKTSSFNRKSQAFTLLEVLLAIGLVSLALLGILGVLISGMRLSNKARSHTTATYCTRSMIETIKAYGGQNLPTGSTTFDGREQDPPDPNTGYPPTPYPKMTINDSDYHFKVSVQDLRPQLALVTVETFGPQGTQILMETLLRR